MSKKDLRLRISTRSVVKHYIKHHAIRKSDVAWASGSSRPTKRTGRTGVKGTGRYKTWTPQMMLKSAK